MSVRVIALLMILGNLSRAQNSWQISRIDQIVGGRYICSVIKCQNSHILVSAENEIVRSTDQGNSWTGPILKLPDGSGDICLTNDPKYGYVYAGVRNGSGGGVYVSKDYGNNWTPVGLTQKSISDIIVDTGGVVVAACNSWNTDGYLFRSTDFGATWSTCFGITFSSGFLCLSKDKHNAIYTATMNPSNAYQTWLYKSIDEGNSWINISTYHWNQVLGIGCDTTGDLLVNGAGWLYLSKDSGKTWTEVLAPQATGTYNYPIVTNKYNYLYASLDFLYRSTDRGTTWTNEGISEHYGMGLISDNDYAYAGAGDLVYRTVDFPPPLPIQPSDRQDSLSLTPTFKWIDSLSDAVSYNLMLSDDSTFATDTLIDTTSLPTKQLTIRDGLLQVGKWYFWRVNGTSPQGGRCLWSTVYRFRTTTQLPISKPILTAPSNDTAHVQLTPLLKWSQDSGATCYRLELDSAQYFQTPIIDTSGLTTVLYHVPSGHLMTRTKYFWRVAASNSSTTSPWSVANQFNTGLFPVLVDPSDGAFTDTLTLLLRWNYMIYAKGFRVQVATDSLFSVIVIDTDQVVPTQLWIPKGILLPNTMYYWRVRAYLEASDSSDWSSPWKFGTIITGIKRQDNLLPKTFSLNQNYPNPFNPSTTIGYDIPKRSQVRLSIYDILGREIAILVNKEVSPGSYEVTFDASCLANGVYFYRIQAGRFVQAKKLILVK